MDVDSIVRGQIVDVDLDPTKGSEQAKIRPCVVVQDNTLNRYSPNTIIVPATGAENVKKVYAVNVPVSKGEGFTKDSVILCNQVRTISKSRIKRVHGRVSSDVLNRIESALKVALALS